MASEMFGVIFVAASLARLGFLARNGFELKYRKWVKRLILIFWGAVFAVGVCLVIS